MVEERLLNWFGAVEHVPDSVIREITKVKKIDHHYEQIMVEIETTTEEHQLAKLLIKLQHLTDLKVQIVGSINDTFGDATDAVKAEFRKIEHESQVFDSAKSEKKSKAKETETKEDGSPGKTKKDPTDKKKEPKKRPRTVPKPDKEQRVKDDRDARKRQKRETEKKQTDTSNNDKAEETYCFCKQVSYGHMICCDNSKCDFGWFHFSCVGLQHKPKGKWFCTDVCKDTQKPAPNGRGRKRRESDNE